MSAKEAALRAFGLAVLEGEVKRAKDQARLEAAEGISELIAETGADRIRVTLPDGTEVATASMNSPKAKVVITDQPGWIAYVAKFHPQHLRVSSDFTAAFLDQLDIDGDDVIDPATGMAAPFARLQPASDAPPSLLIRAKTATKTTPGGKELLIEAYRSGALDLLALPVGET